MYRAGANTEHIWADEGYKPCSRAFQAVVQRPWATPSPVVECLVSVMISEIKNDLTHVGYTVKPSLLYLSIVMSGQHGYE